jgi:hypothetical protein
MPGPVTKTEPHLKNQCIINCCWKVISANKTMLFAAMFFGVGVGGTVVVFVIVRYPISTFAFIIFFSVLAIHSLILFAIAFVLKMISLCARLRLSSSSEEKKADTEFPS